MRFFQCRTAYRIAVALAIGVTAGFASAQSRYGGGEPSLPERQWGSGAYIAPAQPGYPSAPYGAWGTAPPNGPDGYHAEPYPNSAPGGGYRGEEQWRGGYATPPAPREYAAPWGARAQPRYRDDEPDEADRQQTWGNLESRQRSDYRSGPDYGERHWSYPTRPWGEREPRRERDERGERPAPEPNYGGPGRGYGEDWGAGWEGGFSGYYRSLPQDWGLPELK